VADRDLPLMKKNLREFNDEGRQAKTGKPLGIELSGELEKFVNECLAESVVHGAFVPRPGLEPGTCGLTERRARREYIISNHEIRRPVRVLFFRRYAELLPLAVGCDA
jgi:hypothetical protein